MWPLASLLSHVASTMPLSYVLALIHTKGWAHPHVHLLTIFISCPLLIWLDQLPWSGLYFCTCSYTWHFPTQILPDQCSSSKDVALTNQPILNASSAASSACILHLISSACPLSTCNLFCRSSPCMFCWAKVTAMTSEKQSQVG